MFCIQVQRVETTASSGCRAYFDNLCYLALRFHDMPRYGAVFNDVAANCRKVYGLKRVQGPPVSVAWHSNYNGYPAYRRVGCS